MHSKTGTMRSKRKQLRLETNRWKKLLNVMRDENIDLKNRLADILKNDFDKSLLEHLEYFHARFIREDERIGLIRDDVAAIDKIILDPFLKTDEVVKQADIPLIILRNNVSHAEKQFNELKLEFSNCMLKIFGTKINIAAA
jgi:hypothetical protein